MLTISLGQNDAPNQILRLLVVVLVLEALDDDEEDKDDGLRFSTGWRFTSLG